MSESELMFIIVVATTVSCAVAKLTAWNRQRKHAAHRAKYPGRGGFRLSMLLLATLFALPVQAKPGDRIKALIAKLHKEPTPAPGVSQDQPEASRPQRSLLSPRGKAVRQQPAASHPDAPAAPADEPAPKTSTKPTAEWSASYGDSLTATRSEHQPLLVVIDKPGKRLEPSMLENTDLLAPYRLCRLDASTDYGQKAANAFNVKELPFVAIIDKFGSIVLAKKSGSISQAEWEEMLSKYHGGEYAHPTCPTAAKPTAGLSTDESRMVAAINEYRANSKLHKQAGERPPLSVDSVLQRIAEQRVQRVSMAHRGDESGWNHRAFGQWPNEYAHAHGFPGFATENLAMGDLSPEEAVQGWADSGVGHAQQLQGLSEVNGQWVNQHLDLCGVARNGKNYIVMLGHRDSATKPVSFIRTDKCDCAETGICTCSAGKCKCPNCPRKGK